MGNYSSSELFFPYIPTLTKLYLPDSFMNLQTQDSWGYSIDSIVVPSGTKINPITHAQERSSYGIFRPKIVICDNIKYINQLYQTSTYEGIEGFPDKNVDFSLSGALYLKDAIFVGNYFEGSNITEVVFSNKLRVIGSSAFSNCKNLVSVTIPEGLEYIGTGAFARCDKLKSIKLPRSVKGISMYSLIQVEEICFEDGTDVSIAEDAFVVSNIRRIRVPKGKKQQFIEMGIPEWKLLEREPIDIITTHIDQAGTLESRFSKDQLRYVKSLTVSGNLDDRDIQIINSMTNLTDLDLSKAFVTQSEETYRNNIQGTKFLAGILAIDNEAQYRKDKNKMGYKVRSEIINTMDNMADNKAKTPRNDTKCELPEGAFSNLYFLESIRLPEKLTDFEGDIYKLIKSNHLKEVWLSKNARQFVVGAVKRYVCSDKPDMIKFY